MRVISNRRAKGARLLSLKASERSRVRPVQGGSFVVVKSAYPDQALTSVRVKDPVVRWARAVASLAATSAPRGPGGQPGLEVLVRQHEGGIAVPDPTLEWHAQQNVLLREELLQEFGAFTPSRLAEVAGSRSARVNDTFYNWTRHRRVVAVDYGGRRLVPGFYVTPEGLPDDLAGPVIAVLDRLGASEWQQALWWTAIRWQFDGRRGVDVLIDARGASREERVRVGQTLITAADEPRDFF